MDRIATNTAYNSVLANLMNAELAQTTAGNQLSSTGEAPLPTSKAMAPARNRSPPCRPPTARSRDISTTARPSRPSCRCKTPALQPGRHRGFQNSIASITNAIATGNGATLMQQLGNAFDDAVQGLNTTFNGEYVFAGGQVNTPPVSATDITDLTSAPSIASLFHNDNRQLTTQIDQNTQVKTGFLADQVGTPLFTAMQAIEAYNQGPNGPFGATLTQTQQDFLTQTLSGSEHGLE